MTVSHGEDAGESHLPTGAYEALKELVRSPTGETTPIVMQLAPVIMAELHQTLEYQKVLSEERETE